MRPRVAGGNGEAGALLARNAEGAVVCLSLQGDELFRQGDDGDAFYVVYSGTMKVVRPADADGPGFDASIGRSGCVGEMAIAEDRPRIATVTAAEDSVLLRFPRSSFERLLNRPVIGAWKLQRAFAVALSRRLRAVITGSALAS